jgi:hypothetical protein
MTRRQPPDKGGPLPQACPASQREARLAEALRANLQRRKRQARERDAASSREPGPGPRQRERE